MNLISKKFSAAYYPFSYIGQDTLKLYSLFFDRVDVLVPSDTGLMAMPEYERKHVDDVIEGRQKFMDETRILQENEILKLWEPVHKGGVFQMGVEALWWKYYPSEKKLEETEYHIKNRMSEWLWFIEQSSSEGSMPLCDKPIYHQYLSETYSTSIKPEINKLFILIQ